MSAGRGRGGGGGRDGPLPCGACRHMELKCDPTTCPIAPYFPLSLADDFNTACRVFGRPHVVDTVLKSDPQARIAAVKIIIATTRYITTHGWPTVHGPPPSSGYGTAGQEIEAQQVFGPDRPSSSVVDVSTELRLGIGPSQEMDASSTKDATTGFGSSGGLNRGN